jgi:hypothetical protein
MLQYINKKNIIIFITISIIVIALYFYSKKDKIDCKLSDWIWDNQCNCEQPINGQGKKFAYRNIIQKAQNGGKECSNNQDDFYTNELCQCSVSPTPGSQSPDRNGSNIPSVSGKSFERAVYYGFSKINFIDNTNVLFESNKGTYTFNNTTNKGSMTIYQLYQAPTLYYNFSYDSLSKKISIDNLGIYVIVD